MWFFFFFIQESLVTSQINLTHCLALKSSCIFQSHEQFGSRDGNVYLSVHHSMTIGWVNTKFRADICGHLGPQVPQLAGNFQFWEKTSWQLQGDFPWNSVHTFMFPSGWILKPVVILARLTLCHHQVSISSSICHFMTKYLPNDISPRNICEIPS